MITFMASYNKDKLAIILLAAGTGKRFNASLPTNDQNTAKQYWAVAGKPIVRHAAESLLEFSDCVLPVGDIDSLYIALKGCKTLPPIPGGKERQDSVKAGLEYLSKYKPDTELVLIHDSARPFPSKEMIESVIESLKESPGSIPVLPVTDTIKRSSTGFVEETVPRETLWRAQTPQGFHFSTLIDLHRKNTKITTDDAVLLEQNGLRVALVKGSADAIKLTEYDDLGVIQAIAKRKKEQKL